MACSDAPERFPEEGGNLLQLLATESATLALEVRRALRLSPGTPITVSGNLPCGSPVSIGLGVRGGRQPRKAEFRLDLKNSSGRAVLLHQTCEPPDTWARWVDVTVPPPPVCGDVTLRIEAEFIDRRARHRLRGGGSAAGPRMEPIPRELLISHVTTHAPPQHVVLVILADALRADALSAYGASRPASPFLDRLARRGTLFTAAVAAASWTRASVGSLFTSRHPYEHGALNRDDVLGDGLPTLAERLREGGVQTAAFVANGNIGFPRQRFHRGFELFRLVEDPAGSEKTPGRLLVPVLIDWIDRLHGSRAFAYVHLVEPHAPYEPPPPFRGLWDRGPKMRVTGGLQPFRGFRTARDADELAHVRALYHEEVMHADSLVGAILANMARRQIRPSIVFLSDHGESFLDHGAWEHGTTVYEHELHVPLITSGPGFDPVGLDSRPVSLLDIAPTVTSLFGVVPAESFAGSPIGTGRGAEPLAVETLDGKELLALREGHRKGILELMPSVRARYYDLEKDPGEDRPLPLDETPGLRERLLALATRRPGLMLSLEAFAPGDEVRIESFGAIELQGCLWCEGEERRGSLVITPAGRPATALALLRGSPEGLRLTAIHQGEVAWTAAPVFPEGSWEGPPSGGPRVRMFWRLRPASSIPPPTPEELRMLKALGYVP